MPHRIVGFIKYLGDNPSVGVLSSINIFVLGNFETITEVGALFQSLGYIFGGSLAGLTLFAYIIKKFILPFYHFINKK